MPHRLTIRMVVASTTILIILICAQIASATVMPLYPNDGQQLPWTDIRPAVAFDVPQGETPKWVLLSVDPQVKTNQRLCRTFIAVSYQGAARWGCSNWVVEPNANQPDQRKPLVPGTTYYWTVVSEDQAGTRVSSPIRSFKLAPEPNTGNPSKVIADIKASVLGDDGNGLNAGKARYSVSKLRITGTRIRRVKSNRVRIDVTIAGNAVIRSSYIVIATPTGTVKVPVVTRGRHHLKGIFKLSAANQHVKLGTYRVQANVIAKANGADVRSAVRTFRIRKA